MSFNPSYTYNGMSAWLAACSVVADGSWHSRDELSAAMVARGLDPQRVPDILTGAARAGYLERDPEPGHKRRKVKALRFRKTDLGQNRFPEMRARRGARA